MATTFYEKKNNAKTTITNDPLAVGGLSITLATGKGSLFPSSGTFLVTIWDDTTYSGDPTSDPNMEVCLIDSRSTDTLTVNASGRGYAGTADVEHASGNAIALLIVKEHFDQLETAINNLENLKFAKPRARAYLSADQLNIATGTNTLVTLNTEEYDVGSNFGSNVFTAPKDGYYVMKASITYKNTVNDKLYRTRILKNASDTLEEQRGESNGATSGLSVPAGGTHHLDAGDTIGLYAFHSDGAGTSDIAGGSTLGTFLEVTLDEVDV